MRDRLTEETANKLDVITGLIWEGMDALIKSQGYSSKTLNLEGSVYELKKIIEEAEIVEKGEE